jgi:FtsZ-binding cell division protein ZapB
MNKVIIDIERYNTLLMCQQVVNNDLGIYVHYTGEFAEMKFISKDKAIEELKETRQTLWDKVTSLKVKNSELIDEVEVLKKINDSLTSTNQSLVKHIKIINKPWYKRIFKK